MSVVRLSDAREKALNVVLNNREAQGRYDPGRLADLLDELRPLPEFDLTGFDARTLTALRFTPAEALAPVPEAGRVEVTLLTDPATFEELAPELDALVARFDLVTHVRRS